MVDDAYKNALAKKYRLLKELEEVNNFLRLYQRFTPKGITRSEHSDPEPIRGNDPVDNTSSEGRRISVPEKFEPIIRRVILLARKPLSRSELLIALAENGTPIPGDNPGKNLGTIMWRLKDRFINVPGFGYWVKGVTIHEDDGAGVVYDPIGGVSIADALAPLVFGRS